MNFNKLYRILIFFGIALLIAIPVIIINGFENQPRIRSGHFDKFEGYLIVPCESCSSKDMDIRFEIADQGIIDSITGMIKSAGKIDQSSKFQGILTIYLTGYTGDNHEQFELNLTKYGSAEFESRSLVGTTLNFSSIYLYDFFSDYLTENHLLNLDILKE